MPDRRAMGQYTGSDVKASHSSGTSLTRRAFLRTLSLTLVSGVLPAWAGEPPLIAALFPGLVVDKDFNEVGHVALVKAARTVGASCAWSERVTAATAVSVMRSHIQAGAKVLWGHGAQFLGAIQELSAQHQDVAFIGEADSPSIKGGPNVHILGREFHKGFYVLGALAAKVSTTGLISYIGGLPLPVQVNAALAGAKTHGPQVRLHHVNLGDYNDPMRARQAAEVMITYGCDVILSGVNMGNFGIIEAVNQSPSPVLFTTLYTSKREFSPNRFLTSDLFDYSGPLVTILKRVAQGEPGGYLPMPWGEGLARYTQFPVNNVAPQIDQETRRIAKGIEDGSIIVPSDFTQMPPNPG